MKLALVAIVFITAIVTFGFLKWRRVRQSADEQAMLAQARETSARISALMEKDYGPLGTTTDEILSHESDEHASKVLLALLYRIGEKANKRGIQSLTPVERHLPAVSTLEAEVVNGGFDQYFFNFSGGDSETALAGLKEIGATGAARLLERAMAAFPGGKPPPDREKRWKAMEKVASEADSLWAACDKEFYDLKESIDDLLLAYAKRRRSEIILP